MPNLAYLQGAPIKSASGWAGCRFYYQFIISCRAISPMPRFYFDLVLGSFTNHDEVGSEIDSLRAVEIQARRSAGELTRDRLFQLQGTTSEDIRVEVKDEQRQPVLTVTVSIHIDHAGLRPPRSM
ncbi:hypothetical protein ILT44_11610 [Microvirga sp. BT689]|uniref:DUF6894 family protein n=1 Tax=Microvirga arvi TaxID=2778731 RepID=UPI00194EDE00|nr:hypothetical protein [Microvirga arvi]MBM6580831.1 hypothetical protein [Microvirga arvi]